MKQGAQGAVRSWLRQKTDGPQVRTAMQTTIREDGRLRGQRTDAQRKKRAEATKNQRLRRKVLQNNGISTDDATRIRNLATSGMIETHIARKLRIDEQAVYRILEFSRRTRERRIEVHHREQARRMHDIFTEKTQEDGTRTLLVRGIDNGALHQKPDGKWAPNQPLVVALPTLRGLREEQARATDTVARVVATQQRAEQAAGISTGQVQKLEETAQSLRDAVAEFTTRDRSGEVETGTKLTTCARKTCEAAEQMGRAARQQRAENQAMGRTTPGERQTIDRRYERPKDCTRCHGQTARCAMAKPNWRLCPQAR